ncbi:hypothetical protein [Qipengyuania sediminis]|uniref:hypothetical protein n=1 Tax=Qipengyuania sediminis TaxID=1532023 RepID=UPI0010596780|nr:hypothetical protein [Qipengyuania sediminis]
MRIKVAAGALALTLAACADIPRDPERTEALVRETGTIRLGWVAGTKDEPAAIATLQQVSGATGAKVERREGDSETLLAELEEGKIDLVYGAFAMASPWAKHVHLGRALGYRAEPPKHVAALRFAYRNGENGWIGLVEEAAKP